MYSVEPPFFFRFFNPDYLSSSYPPGNNKVYLTFDDGPVPEVTPQVLNILAQHQAKATFFCVGDNVRKHRSLFEEVVAAGHSVGNHTFHHLNGWKTPPALYAEDVNRCRDYFQTNLFRPPYGRYTPSQYFLLRKEYKIILW
ncbi:MAG: polysaccharide deacetylase family protein, partial [Syntrophothermus sp.]